MGAPQARISELAFRLVKKGHTVSVLTAMPNYPQGKIFDAYKNKLFMHENYKEIKVIRSWIYPTKSINIVKRLCCYFSFVVSSALRGTFLTKQDIIVVESPPLFLGLTGMYLSLVLRAKMIFNVSDLWPDSAIELGVISNKLYIALAKAIETLCYRFSSLITGQSPTIVTTIQHRAEKKRVELITNGVDTKLFSPTLRSAEVRQRLAGDNKFIIVYTGLFGIAQGLEQILEAAKLLENHPDIAFVLIGDGPQSEFLLKKIHDDAIANVKVLPSVAKSEVPSILASCDMALIPLKRAITGAVPSKIYEAMASGLPIIYVGYGDAVNIIAESGAGAVIKPGAVNDIAECIKTHYVNKQLLGTMSKNGVAFADKYYSRDGIANKFDEIILNI